MNLTAAIKERHRVTILLLLLLALGPALPAQGAAHSETTNRIQGGQTCPPSGREQALFDAINRKDAATVKALLAEGVSPNASSEIQYEQRYGYSVACAPALMLAVKLNDLETVQALLSAKADVNGKDTAGRLVWNYAFNAFRLPDDAARLFKMLIGAGADIKARDARGRTLLHLAVTEGKVEPGTCPESPG